MVSVAAPITPVHRPTMSGRSPESDSDELSPAQDFGFDYVYDDEGRLAPVPRATQAVRSPSPSPSRPPPEDNLRRASGDAQIKDSRTFQRVSSGPALNNFPKMPRRVTMEDPAAAPDLEQEKENFRNIAVVPKRVSAAASLGGGGRIMRSGEQPRAPLAYTRGVAKLGMLTTNARVGRISEGDQRSDSEGIEIGDTEVGMSIIFIGQPTSFNSTSSRSPTRSTTKTCRSPAWCSCPTKDVRRSVETI
ncbi:hypothetical protein DL96DRAFT_173783 [Flagelloscypha sp. PMI_526]|nr:hypothetical protein DL96DRAFT_173783 [Flagelloscypha sp. PMI_526]